MRRGGTNWVWPLSKQGKVVRKGVGKSDRTEFGRGCIQLQHLEK